MTKAVRYDRFDFEIFENGDVTVVLSAEGKQLFAFNIDDVDRDNFLNAFKEACKATKKGRKWRLIPSRTTKVSE